MALKPCLVELRQASLLDRLSCGLVLPAVRPQPTGGWRPVAVVHAPGAVSSGDWLIDGDFIRMLSLQSFCRETSPWQIWS